MAEGCLCVKVGEIRRKGDGAHGGALKKEHGFYQIDRAKGGVSGLLQKGRWAPTNV